MSTWRYCYGCQQGLDYPTTREILTEDGVYCCCGIMFSFNEDEKKQAMEQVLDRLEAIETRLGILS